MALDRSFEPDPELKGSYYRRLEDIPLALAKFDVTALPTNSPAQNAPLQALVSSRGVRIHTSRSSTLGTAPATEKAA
jgi:hypothetical protein